MEPRPRSTGSCCPTRRTRACATCAELNRVGAAHAAPGPTTRRPTGSLARRRPRELRVRAPAIGGRRGRGVRGQPHARAPPRLPAGPARPGRWLGVLDTTTSAQRRGAARGDHRRHALAGPARTRPRSPCPRCVRWWRRRRRLDGRLTARRRPVSADLGHGPDRLVFAGQRCETGCSCDLRRPPAAARRGAIQPAHAAGRGGDAGVVRYFIAIGALIPTVPRFVEGELGGDGLAVGIGVGSMAVTAAALRPWVGRMGDTHGRRVLGWSAALVVAVSIPATPWPSLWMLVVARLVTGAGEAAMFVGVARRPPGARPPPRRGGVVLPRWRSTAGWRWGRPSASPRWPRLRPCGRRWPPAGPGRAG